MGLKQMLCRHEKVQIYRAHASMFKDHHHLVAWVDRHGVFNYVRCCDCGQILDASATQTMDIYGKPKE